MHVAWSFMVRLLLLLVLACSGDPQEPTRAGGTTRLPVGTDASTGAGAGGPSAAPNATMPGMFEPLGPTCGKTDLAVSRTVPNVMLLVDGSSSMKTSYGPAPSSSTSAASGRGGSVGAGSAGAGGASSSAPQATRWSAIRDALVKPDVGVVPQLQDKIKFGLAVFGTQPMCPLPLDVVDPSLNNYQKIHDGFPVEPPGMTTPTGRAMDLIVTRLDENKMANDPTDAASPRIIVLATDGDPNDCELSGPQPNYEPSIQAALKAQSRSQRLYVISVGQDAAAAHLQELANIGSGKARTANPGAPVFYPTDPVQLAKTLETLIGSVALCEVQLDGTGVMPGMECAGEVALNGTPLLCNDPNGWALIDSLHIRLQGSACESFKTGGATMLRARFPCATLIPD
jgi:hypothetical protein